jgi:hypothetical protein
MNHYISYCGRSGHTDKPFFCAPYKKMMNAPAMNFGPSRKRGRDENESLRRALERPFRYCYQTIVFELYPAIGRPQYCVVAGYGNWLYGQGIPSAGSAQCGPLFAFRTSAVRVPPGLTGKNRKLFFEFLPQYNMPYFADAPHWIRMTELDVRTKFLNGTVAKLSAKNNFPRNANEVLNPFHEGRVPFEHNAEQPQQQHHQYGGQLIPHNTTTTNNMEHHHNDDEARYEFDPVPGMNARPPVVVVLLEHQNRSPPHVHVFIPHQQPRRDAIRDNSDTNSDEPAFSDIE